MSNDSTSPAIEEPPPLLRVDGLARHFDVSPPLLDRLMGGGRRQLLKAVDGLTFEIPRGSTFSLVGESGCGKSTVARCVVGLYRLTSGRILLDGTDVANLAPPQAKIARRRMQMIFQDPYASLNPRWRVRDIIAEPMRVHGDRAARSGALDRVDDLLRQVRLAPTDGDKYPHEFSGGQRQRISIARALASQPDFLVCDEPTSALDVSVQAQILNLMRQLQEKFGLTFLFISHNLAVVSYMSDNTGVMYLGRLVEWGASRSIFATPRHPYTRLLLDTIPDLSMSGRERAPVSGEVPSPLNPPPGCTFHPRCSFANSRCRSEIPEARLYEDVRVACHGVEEGRVPVADHAGPIAT